jgi:hypothetical protein
MVKVEGEGEAREPAQEIAFLIDQCGRRWWLRMWEGILKNGAHSRNPPAAMVGPSLVFQRAHPRPVAHASPEPALSRLLLAE